MTFDDRTRSQVFEDEDGGPRLLIFWPGGFLSRPIAAGDAFVVGRARECDLCVDHPSVSRRHACIRAGVGVEIEDLGSRHGTQVGKVVLRGGERAPLAEGVVAQIGVAAVVLKDAEDTFEHRARGPVPNAIETVDHVVNLVASSPLSVILLGETGVGKEVTAQTIHRRSARSEGPFVRLNCAAFTDSLLEAELFGYVRGAFTGAVKDKPGLLEIGNGGTVFLDELGEMPLSTQAKLLRVVENREILPVGGVEPRPIDVRFVSATNQDLQELIARGAFRRDLYYRLNGVSIAIPPLRDRKHEIEGLARAFLARATTTGEPPPVLSVEAISALHGHDWPGNIRELRTAIERASLFCGGAAIGPEHLRLGADVSLPSAKTSASQPPAGPSSQRLDLRSNMRDFERQRIVDALAQANGNQTQAAQLLGISRRTLIDRMEAYELPRPRKRAPRS